VTRLSAEVALGFFPQARFTGFGHYAEEIAPSIKAQYPFN